MNNSEKNGQLSPRERILLTAAELFYADGIRATGIDRLIKQSAVAKVTFYRYFPSKNSLIIAFLEYRHLNSMAWFSRSISAKSEARTAIVDTLRQWFEHKSFRGCAFINSVVELGGTVPEVVDISRRHKQELTELLHQFLPATTNMDDAIALSLAIDGAIIRAQFERSSINALKGLQKVVDYYYS